ncbi:MAG TPA: MFS transporter [Desulfobacterales bacterium]|nr:MFS transporter [Desulfobacterales bacterium]
MTERSFSIPDRPFTRTAVACQYFLYFGVMGIYLPYFNLYCYHLGFSGFDIGVLSALRSVAMVVFPMAWGALADRTRGRRPIYILCNIASAAIWTLFLTTDAFGPMAVIIFLYGIFYAPIISFLEAISMETLGRERQSYGRIRLWGSIGFITLVLAFGALIGVFSERVIIIAIGVGSILLAMISVSVPRDRPSGAPLSVHGAKMLLRRRPAVFLACAFLMLVSHGAYYGFFSIHLSTLGYTGTFIGVAWALASAAEIFAMLYSEAIFKRFALERVLLVSFAAAVLRWWVLGASASAAIILLSQLLHAMTYGTFHMASILYIDRLAPAGAKNLGQALNNALTYGLGLMTGFFINGYLYGVTGSSGLFRVSSLIALAGGLGFAAFQVRGRPSDEGRGLNGRERNSRNGG